MHSFKYLPPYLAYWQKNSVLAFCLVSYSIQRYATEKSYLENKFIRIWVELLVILVFLSHLLLLTYLI